MPKLEKLFLNANQIGDEGAVPPRRRLGGRAAEAIRAQLQQAFSDGKGRVEAVEAKRSGLL